MKDFITHQYQSLEDKYNSKSKIFNLLIIILLCLNFVLLGIDGINTNLDPEGWDTTAYLGEANLIKNQGGVAFFFNLCITGKYKQANQHPFYILLLTPFASTDISFFINAKIISAIIGLIFLLVLFVITKKMFGDLVASVTVFGLVLNIIFLEWTTLVACESLLMLFSFLCMYFVITGFNDNKYWAYAGVFAGLAYLTKGTSLILLPGFGLATLIIYKLKIFKNKFFWSFFIFFAIVSSPLFIRNIIVYQNPFFNVNNYIVTYGIDYLEENRYVTYSPNEGATLWKFDKIGTNSTNIKTPASNSFNLFSSASNVINGIQYEMRIFLYSINVFGKHLSGNLFWISGFLLFLFFIVGLSRKNNRGGKIYFILTILIFLALLSFNPIDRYFLPIVPLIWIYIVLGIFTVLDLVGKWISLKNQKFDLILYVPPVLIIILLIYSIIILSTKTIANPLNSVEYSDSRLDLLNWLKTNLKEDEKYTLGPNFNWQLETGMWILPPDNAKFRDFAKFKSFIKRHNVSYVLIDRKHLEKTNMVMLKQANFLLDPFEGVVEKKSVDSWELVYQDHRKPVDFLVYKLVK